MWLKALASGRTSAVPARGARVSSWPSRMRRAAWANCETSRHSRYTITYIGSATATIRISSRIATPDTSLSCQPSSGSASSNGPSITA